MALEGLGKAVAAAEYSSEVQRSDAGASEWFPVNVLAAEAALILGLSVATGATYHWIAYGTVGPLREFALLGGLAAFWFVLVCSHRSDYELERFLAGGRGFSNLFNAWTSVFVALLLIGFLTKTSDMLSRGWLILFYALGLIAVNGSDLVLRRLVAAAARDGRLRARRVMLIGTPDRIDAFMAAGDARQAGVAIVAVKVLPTKEGELVVTSEPELQAMLRTAVDEARLARITDVVLIADPQQEQLVTSVVGSLIDLPATIHLGGIDLLHRFPQLRAERVGLLRTFSLVRAPMSFAEKLMKRGMDLTLALLALIALAPLFVAVAILIKLDSRGPVFFRQRRRGYNQAEFRIFKFRTMTTMDDGDRVRQASRNDARITRIGRFLRRSNIDELPQLINVLRGEMSLVGPRPHAVAHDVHYERMIERYARRLNVKPGITGWAQVNGFRGPTEKDEQMRARVLHDLYYIDNWSVALDLRILFRTVFSPRAYRNAF